MKVVNCSLDLIKYFMLEVESLKSEAEHTIKELADVHSESLVSKREQIHILTKIIQ